MVAQENNLSHLTVVFEEILPSLAAASIKYWVFGGIAIAGVVGKVLRSEADLNGDVDVYVLEKDFHKAETVLRTLVEHHGDWDADRWVVRYSMMKGTKRPKVELEINKKQRFSIVPVYPGDEGVEFRVLRTDLLPLEALIQVERVLGGYRFYTPPTEVLKAIFRNFINERLEKGDYIIAEGRRRRHDALALFTADEMADFDRRGADVRR